MDIEYKNKVYSIDKPMKVVDVLKQLRISPDTVIVVRGDELMHLLDIVRETDRLKVLDVVSGG